MKKNKRTRGEIMVIFSCFQNITTFSGMSGKGQVILLDNMEAVGKLVDTITRAEERFIKTLQTPAVKQAAEIIQSIEAKDEKTEGDLENLAVQQDIISEADAQLNAYKNENYNVEVDFPELEKLPKEDFYAIIERNVVGMNEKDEQGNPKIGLYPNGVKILKELIF